MIGHRISGCSSTRVSPGSGGAVITVSWTYEEDDDPKSFDLFCNCSISGNQLSNPEEVSNL